MAYLLVVMEPRGQRQTRTRAEGERCYALMTEWGGGLAERGLLQGANALKTDTEGARVEVRGGKAVVRDGPYAEAKEMVGGYFLIDCNTREQALALAKECPAAQWASIEVREIGTCYDDLQ